jgi:hypothetical protein
MAGPVGALDVGVEAVPDRRARRGAVPLRGEVEHAGSGLPTTVSGPRPSAVSSAATRLPLPGNGPRGDGQRGVGVGGHPARAGPHGHARLARSAQPTFGRTPE